MESTTDEVNVPNDRRLQRRAVDEVDPWRQEPSFLFALTFQVLGRPTQCSSCLTRFRHGLPFNAVLWVLLLAVVELRFLFVDSNGFSFELLGVFVWQL